MEFVCIHWEFRHSCIRFKHSILYSNERVKEDLICTIRYTLTILYIYKILFSKVPFRFRLLSRQVKGEKKSSTSLSKYCNLLAGEPFTSSAFLRNLLRDVFRGFFCTFTPPHHLTSLPPPTPHPLKYHRMLQCLARNRQFGEFSCGTPKRWRTF